MTQALGTAVLGRVNTGEAKASALQRQSSTVKELKGGLEEEGLHGERQVNGERQAKERKHNLLERHNPQFVLELSQEYGVQMGQRKHNGLGTGKLEGRFYHNPVLQLILLKMFYE